MLLGGSAPELNGLRKTPADPLTPSVQIQANAVEQIVAGHVPSTLATASIAQPLTILVIGVLAVVLGGALPPAAGTAILSATIALLWIAAIAVSVFADRLVDPLTPSVAAALVFAVTAGTAYSCDAQARSVASPSARTASRAGGRPPHHRTTGLGQAEWRAA